MSSNNGFPWQKTAKNLIEYAQKFQRTNDEFERQVGYLLLDVGVETLFRVFVTQPGVEARLGYTKRDKIAKGTIEKTNIQRDEITLSGFDELAFHKLTEAVNQIAGEKINKNDLRKVEYFHNIRNKIYHLGDGIVPTKENFEEYLMLAQSFLKTLLGVGEDQQLMSELTPEEVLNYVGRELELSMAPFYAPRIFQDLCLNIAVAAEAFAPKSTSKRFEKSLKKIKQSFPDNEDDSVLTRYENQLQRIDGFKELIGNEDDIDFIDKVLDDITYLYLDILMSLNVVSDNDIDNYGEYRYFFERFQNRPDDASREDREKILQLEDWAKKIEEKLDSLAPKQKLDSQKEEDK